MTRHSRPPEAPATGSRSAAASSAATGVAARKKEIVIPGLDEDSFALIENASDVIFTHDLTGQITYLNQTAVELTGFSKQEGLTMNIVDIVAPEYKQHARETMMRKFQGEPIVGVYELEILTKDGKRIAMEVNNRLIYKEGNAVGMQGIARDLRDRRREHEALLESENKFRALAETAQSAIFIYKGDHFVFFNEATQHITGYTQQELRTITMWDLVHPDHRQFVKQRSRERLSGGNPPPRYEIKIVRKDGRIRWLDFMVSLIPHEGSLAVLCIGLDVTERKDAENELQVQKAYWEHLFEQAPEAIVIVDKEMRIQRMNHEFTRMFGFPLEGNEGVVIDDLIVPADLKEEGKRVAADVLAGRTVKKDTVRRRRDGTLLNTSVVVTPINVGGGLHAYYAIYRDITDRHRGAKIESALYRIAETTSKSRDLDELYAAIHDILSELMPADNCYIAVYDPKTEMISFPYFVDEVDTDMAPQPLGKGATAYVLRTGQPLLATPEVFEEMERQGEVELIGAPSIDWMGVPLKDGDVTFGVLALQSYRENVRYGERDKEILTFVSQHIAAAIAQKRSDSALRESEGKFRAVADTATSAIYVQDHGQLLYVNRAAELMTGYSKEELLSMPAWDLLHPDFKHLENFRAPESMEQGEPLRMEFKMVRKTGEVRWWDFSGCIVWYGGKRALLGTAFDATERKQSEQLQSALYRIASKASTAQDLNELYAFIHAVLGEFMYARNCFIALHDKAHNMIHFPYFVDERDPARTPTSHPSRPYANRLTEYVMRTGEPLLATPEMLIELERHGEVQRYGPPSLDWMGIPLKIGDETFGVLVLQSYEPNIRYGQREKEILTFVSQQISSAIETKRHQQAIQESESKFRAVAETAPAAIFIYRGEKVIYVNPASEAILGYTRDELLKKNILEFVSPEMQELVRRRLVSRAKGERLAPSLEIKVRVGNGQDRWMNFSGAPIQYQGEPAVMGIGIDVHERKLAEQESLLQKAHLEQLFEHAPEAMAIQGPDQRVVRVNREFTNLFGYTPKEAIGHYLDELIAPKDLEKEARSITQDTTLGNTVGAETKRKRKDGTLVDVSILGTSVGVDGGEVSFYAIYRDISRRKQAEQQLQELNASLEQRVNERTAQLQAANKELEAFSYSVSHDLRAPLRHINGFVQLLSKKDGPNLDGASQRYLKTIADSAQRMGALIDDLLAFSRTSRVEMRSQPVALDNIVNDVRKELAHLCEGRTIHWEISDLPVVKGDPPLLRVVWMNLIANAIKYTSPRAEARIEITPAPVGTVVPDDAVDHGALSANNCVVMVRDNGVGFDMSYAHKLFGVFQRLHREEEFEGTGIGLATVRRIVHRHGGAVWAEGKPNEGATIYLSLRKGTVQ
ncbi:MAG: PAS domain S-box protein [Terriglobales bacterium]